MKIGELVLQIKIEKALIESRFQQSCRTDIQAAFRDGALVFADMILEFIEREGSDD